MRRVPHSYRARLCHELSTLDPGRACRHCPNAGVGMNAPPDCHDAGTSAEHHQSRGATQHRSVGRVRRLLGPCRCAAPSSADPADGATGTSPPWPRMSGRSYWSGGRPSRSPIGFRWTFPTLPPCGSATRLSTIGLRRTGPRAESGTGVSGSTVAATASAMGADRAPLASQAASA